MRDRTHTHDATEVTGSRPTRREVLGAAASVLTLAACSSHGYADPAEAQRGVFAEQGDA